jgi:hypothetical protein
MDSWTKEQYSEFLKEFCEKSAQERAKDNRTDIPFSEIFGKTPGEMEDAKRRHGWTEEQIKQEKYENRMEKRRAREAVQSRRYKISKRELNEIFKYFSKKAAAGNV